jgi:hypothetical protein
VGGFGHDRAAEQRAIALPRRRPRRLETLRSRRQRSTAPHVNEAVSTSTSARHQRHGSSTPGRSAHVVVVAVWRSATTATRAQQRGCREGHDQCAEPRLRAARLAARECGHERDEPDADEREEEVAIGAAGLTRTRGAGRGRQLGRMAGGRWMRSHAWRLPHGTSTRRLVVGRGRQDAVKAPIGSWSGAVAPRAP